MSGKSQEAFQNQIKCCIEEIHLELDRIFHPIVEDRSYGNSRRDQTGGGDLDLLKRLYGQFIGTLGNFYKTEDKQRRGNWKGLLCGAIDVELVASIALRPIRINPMTSPRQVRVDKKSFDSLMENDLPCLQLFSWKVFKFLFENCEFGTESFEMELAELVRDRLRTDLKGFKENLSSCSQRALEEVSALSKSAKSFNGQVLLKNLIDSGVLAEGAEILTNRIVGIFRAGVQLSEDDSGKKSKRARYHQVSDSDRSRQIAAEESFSAALSSSFQPFASIMTVFQASQVVISTEQHVKLSNSLLSVITCFIQSQHNYVFHSQALYTHYFPKLYEALGRSLVTFQPAYIPPFAPLALSLLSNAAGRSDESGQICRRALIEADVLLHPRRSGPVTFRPTENAAIERIFERPAESAFVPEVFSDVEEDISSSPAVPSVPEAVEDKVADIFTSMKPVASSIELKEEPMNSTPKQSQKEESDGNDEPLPQIVDCEPDEF